MFWFILMLNIFIIGLIIAIHENEFRFFALAVAIDMLLFLLILLCLAPVTISLDSMIKLKSDIEYYEILIPKLDKKESYTLQEYELNKIPYLVEYKKYKDMVIEFNKNLELCGNRNKYRKNFFYIHLSNKKEFDEMQFIQLKEF